MFQSWITDQYVAAFLDGPHGHFSESYCLRAVDEDGPEYAEACIRGIGSRAYYAAEAGHPCRGCKLLYAYDPDAAYERWLETRFTDFDWE